MKKISPICLLFFIGSFLFAQSGYKDFQFGMSMEEIKTKFPDIKEPSYGYQDDTLFYVIQHLYKSELEGAIPNPLKGLEDFKVLSTGDNAREDDFTFLFHNNRLVGIITYYNFYSQHYNNLIGALNDKYGNGSTYGVQYANNSSNEGTLWVDNQRFIVWEHHNLSYSPYLRFQTVTYLDAVWLREVCKKRMEEFRKEQEQLKSRL